MEILGISLGISIILASATFLIGAKRLVCIGLGIILCIAMSLSYFNTDVLYDPNDWEDYWVIS